MVSGPSASFDVSPVINGGTEAKITIKQNSRFFFGIFAREDCLQEGEVQANMFDAQECSRVKKIQIWRSEEGQIGAATVLTDRPEPQNMVSTGSEHYRDGDRVTRKDWLGWGVKLGSNTVSLVGRISGAVQGLM